VNVDSAEGQAESPTGFALAQENWRRNKGVRSFHRSAFLLESAAANVAPSQQPEEPIKP
jgi:hypothetical protein